MMTIHRVLKEAEERLKDKACTPLLDAQVILCHILSVDRLYLIVNKDRILTDEDVYEYNKLIEKRLNGVPVQYLTGRQEFMGLEFCVGEGVLIPRPDTEILIERILDFADDNNEYKIVDIGTGSGAITVSLARFIKKAYIYSIDISEKALGIAMKNANNHGVESRISFLNGSLFEPLDNIDVKGKVDILVSNPPYIPTEEIEKLQVEVSKYEPRIALDGGEDGMNSYKAIIDRAHEYLRTGGFIALEVGHDQARKVISLMEEKNKYVDIKITKDLAGIERVVSAKIQGARC